MILASEICQLTKTYNNEQEKKKDVVYNDHSIEQIIKVITEKIIFLLEKASIHIVTIYSKK